MAELLNPYIAGAPVVERNLFFGRQDVFDWVERSLTGKYVNNILVIHGQRRVGKTSVLKQIPYHLPSKYIQVFFDLQGRTNTTLDRFLWWLAREISRTLRQERQLSLPVPDQAAFAEDNEYLHNRFLPDLWPLLGDQTLLLTFDEFDALDQPEIRETLARPLIDYLSRLFGDLERLSFIFSIGSSGHKLEDMQAAYTNFFKTALYKKISFLAQEDCYQLITRPVAGVIEYKPQAIAHIYQVTAGHPYFTQLLCHELFSLCQKTGKRSLAAKDVDDILEDVVERGTVNLKFAWDEATPLEKWVLACLAQGDGGADGKQLVEVLKRQRVRYSESDLNAALLHLRDKDILTGDNRFVVSLMQLWLRRNRPLERVRQELVEVNPIANRYVEIGEEYRALGDQVKALDCFQQALVVDPQNLKAQVSLAAIYQGEGNHSQALQAYEAALAIDVEDIAARAGFCETNLALGDQARAAQEIEQAAQSYRRVLSINADHTEALQRLADIYALKAEQALDQGRDDDALIALKEALQFTPEDPALEARLAEVQAQKLAKIVKSALEKSQQEAATRQWKRAITTLEGALEITPGEAQIEQALSEVKAAQRKYLLESLADRARSLASAERWEEALAAWQEYLDLEPEDAEAARTALGQVETQRELDQFYIQALEALEKKDYPQAVGLLKRVVFQDEAYKNAARLLAQAIEAQRARRSIWRLWSRLYAGSESTRLEAQRARHPVWRKWMWAGLALLALVVLVWASFLLLPGWFQAASNSPAKTTMLLEESPTSQAEQAVKQTLVEIVRTSTPMVTPTNTPPATPTYTPPPTYTPTLTYTRIPTRTPILTPVAGATQVSPVDGMVMIYVPAGEFLMGKGENEAADDDEKPQHRVYLDSYWIDRTEVTNAMYALCVHAGVCQSPISTSSDTRESYFGNPQFDAYPVIFVSWDDAKAYCTWAGRRLPTEAEWEKAARWDPLAGSARRFPWGDEIRYCEHANCTTCVGDTNEVGSYSAGASAYGALDMAGNVWEWVADWYDGDYYSAYSLDGWPANPMGPSVGWYRVLRGGSWYSYSGWDLRAGNRVQGNGTNSKTGFRCAYTP